MRDFPSLNRLIEGVEHGDRTIAMCVMATLEDINLSAPPGLTFTLENFPFTYLLMIGTMWHLLTSEAILQARNHLTYSDGQGVQVNQSDHASMYLNLTQKFQSEYEQKKQNFIVKENIARAMGPGGSNVGVYSDFSQLMDFDHYLTTRRGGS